MSEASKLKELGCFFESILENAFDTSANGNLPRWLEAYSKLPEIDPTEVNIDTDTPFAKGDIDTETKLTLTENLHMFHPWRKGPFELFNIFIDTEWRSDWKWNRLSPHIDSWQDKNVFDIGCGNGYHCFRIASGGAKSVTGIDTSLLSIMQFKTLQKYFKKDNIEIFPVGIQNIPKLNSIFDTVLSMGVLYHRTDPLEHLEKIYDLLVPGGECVVETLIIDGNENDCLEPIDRYAMMKNVYRIPSVTLLEKWLDSTGFYNIRTVDVTVTSPEEQRSTDWMRFHSLSNFLAPEDASKTIEGYPAPKRAMVIANKDKVR
jgi:tRNA (mo5U34)-methyltransferase